jgi:hypothetical protein
MGEWEKKGEGIVLLNKQGNQRLNTNKKSIEER